jgi:hypothetical protein
VEPERSPRQHAVWRSSSFFCLVIVKNIRGEVVESIKSVL